MGLRKKHGPLVIGLGVARTGMSTFPHILRAYYLRSRNPTPAILYDAAGTRIGELRTNPKTGKRTRVLDG